jgi:hypothetical protein
MSQDDLWVILEFYFTCGSYYGLFFTFKLFLCYDPVSGSFYNIFYKKTFFHKKMKLFCYFHHTIYINRSPFTCSGILKIYIIVYFAVDFTNIFAWSKANS